MAVVYRDVLRFDSVVVLQSIPTYEKQTGSTLYARVLKPWQEANPGVRASIHDIDDREHFFVALNAIKDNYLKNGRIPILHIESHGEEHGLVLCNGDVIRWEELRDILTEMNELSGLNLLVVMAMCSGWYLTHILHPIYSAPAWGIIGPTTKVWDADLRNAMIAFYTEIFTSYDAQAALTAMNSQRSHGDWTYVLQTAEGMLCEVFSYYIKTFCTEDQRAERENEIVAEIVRRRGYDLSVAFETRAEAKALLADEKKFFYFYRERFLMLDKHEANRGRFKVTYEQCAAL